MATAALASATLLMLASNSSADTIGRYGGMVPVRRQLVLQVEELTFQFPIRRYRFRIGVDHDVAVATVDRRSCRRS